MPKTYSNPRYPYRRSPDQDRQGAHHPVVIVGAGLVGLTAAVDLATRGIATVVLDDDDTVSYGSRAICFAKRTLEIYDRLGIGDRLRDKGVTWNRGKVFFGERMIYDFDLLPEGGHCWPAFVNLQQYYAEQWLVERAEETGLVELRWKNRVTEATDRDDHVTLTVETPEGPYSLAADYLLACDGARSQVRRSFALPFEGQVFQDRFLIADVVMQADFPSERWFWFDPPFHSGQSALLHRQPDNVWRIDLQLGPDADPDEETRPERVIPRLKAMLGEDIAFELEWVSLYSFQCRRLRHFRHRRTFFLGDSAHQVSPFGARGGNGGVQDADNLCWKLAAVLQGRATKALLDSYEAERIPAAEENLRHSARSTDFISPKSATARAFRDAVLELAAEHPFARGLVNSGRLSRAYCPPGRKGGGLAPGAPCEDAPLRQGNRQDWLLHLLQGDFFGLYFAGHETGAAELEKLERLAAELPGLSNVVIGTGGCDLATAWQDAENCARQRYGLAPGGFVLVRPDQHVVDSWPVLDGAAVARSHHACLNPQ
jgi:3-(3-hydroxy-phenyl)propionate hydroxylase